MSSYPKCPAREIRTVEVADGILYRRRPRCTSQAGCILKDALMEDLLGFSTLEEIARREAKYAAARAREERIQAAREAVLEAARAEYAAGQRYHRDQTLEANDAHTDALVHYQRCVVAMIEAEGETP